MSKEEEMSKQELDLYRGPGGLGASQKRKFFVYIDAQAAKIERMAAEIERLKRRWIGGG